MKDIGPSVHISRGVAELVCTRCKYLRMVLSGYREFFAGMSKGVVYECTCLHPKMSLKFLGSSENAPCTPDDCPERRKNKSK